MAIDFPNSPTLNQTFTSSGKTWTWNGYSWDTVTTVISAGPAGQNGTNGTDGSFSSTQTILSKSASYSLSSSDVGALVTNTAAITVTVTGLTTGQQVDFLQTNAGQITFTAISPDTLVSKGSKLKTAGQYSVASIKCIAANTYVLAGDLGA